MQAERLQLASRTNNTVVDFVALNKVSLVHAPWFNEVKHAMCSSVRQQQESCSLEESTAAAVHAATASCNRQPVAGTQTEQHAVASSPAAQSVLTCEKRSVSMPPRAPQRPQTAPSWSKSAAQLPTARPWTAHCSQRSNGSDQEKELSRVRARPGSGGSPTASCAPLQAHHPTASRLR